MINFFWPYRNDIYIRVCNSKNIVSVSLFGAISKATSSSLQKGTTFRRSIYLKKVMKLLVFIFEQPS